MWRRDWRCSAAKSRRRNRPHTNTRGQKTLCAPRKRIIKNTVVGALHVLRAPTRDIVRVWQGMIPTHQKRQAQSILLAVAMTLAMAGLGLWVLKREAERAVSKTFQNMRLDQPSPQLTNLITTVKLIKGVTEFMAKHPPSTRPSSPTAPAQPGCTTPAPGQRHTESHCPE